MKAYRIAGETLWLTPQRAIFWEAEKTILVSDCHMGKTGHFRREGIAVPQDVYKEDLRRLVHLLQFFKAEQLIVVGDLFHSRGNRELDLFLRWRLDFSGLSIHLVRGNHDILEDGWYAGAGITLHEGTLHRKGFSFTHHPPEERPEQPFPRTGSTGPTGSTGTADSADSAGSIGVARGENYLFTGHLHPSVTMRGAGKQTLRFPCFYFGKNYAILPAFGQFTGTARVDAQPGDQLFAIVNQEIIHLS